MMKTKTIIRHVAMVLFSMVILSSCSKNNDDDESPNESNRPSSFTVTDDSNTITTYEITYTDFDKIESMRISFDDLAFRMVFSYNAENRLTRFDNGNGTILNMSYGSDGKISGYNSTSFNAIVTETTTGFKTKNEGGFISKYSFNSTDQLTKIEMDLFPEVNFTVQNEGFGAFKNVDIDKILYALPSFSQLYFNKQAFTATVNYLTKPSLNFNNTFNEQGLLKTSVVYATDVSNPTLTIKYSY